MSLKIYTLSNILDWYLKNGLVTLVACYKVSSSNNWKNYCTELGCLGFFTSSYYRMTLLNSKQCFHFHQKFCHPFLKFFPTRPVHSNPLHDWLIDQIITQITTCLLYLFTSSLSDGLLLEITSILEITILNYSWNNLRDVF